MSIKKEQLLLILNYYHDRSKDFRPVFDRIHELRALVPACTPMLATTATVTKTMRDAIVNALDMTGCHLVCESPNKPNITYEVQRKSTVEEDFKDIVKDLAENNIKACCMLVYCQSLDVCFSPHSLSSQPSRYLLLSSRC